MSNSKAPKLSVTIPAYNEGRRIAKTLGSVGQYLSKQTYSSEVIVVDNGSSDDTAAVVLESAEKYPFIKLDRYEPGCGGKGCAVKFGVEKAQGEVVMFMDADNATKISEIEKFWPALEVGKVAIGSRYLTGSNITQKQTFLRQMISRIGNLIIRMILVPGIKDTQCGFKVFPAAAAKEIFRRQIIIGWGFDLEVIALARKLGYKVVEIPVKWEDVGGGQLVPMKATLEVFGDLFKIRLNIWKGKYELKK